MYSQASDILNPLSNNSGNLPVPLSSGLLPVRIGAERPGLAMMGESQFQTSQINNSVMNSINTLDFKQTFDLCVDKRWHWVIEMGISKAIDTTFSFATTMTTVRHCEKFGAMSTRKRAGVEDGPSTSKRARQALLERNQH
ncbi:unnamed protein product [Orchesella dallaii]|uniref:Uncharacterized protein n=1 Tax=Orchesella dallaii TaxID=48710 RepID=A0ABP1RP34_9HEXA